MRFGRRLAYYDVQVNDERGTLPQFIGAAEGMNMLWNLIGTIGRHGKQPMGTPAGSEPRLVERPKLAKASPVFDAWLQAYRKRLEESCRREDPATLVANANG